MRSVALLIPVLALLWCGVLSCGPVEPLGSHCTVSTDCAAGDICVDNGCVADPGGPLPIGGEGEGQHSGEGEGEQHGGEGEGHAGGEGEGQQHGGEGEGQQQSGEGEGQAAGEGEGEGTAPPTCNPDCGSLQSCTATDVCTDDNGTNVCEVFDGSTVDFFADQQLTLDGSGGGRFFFDGEDRFYVDRLTQMRPGMTVFFDVQSSFDTVIYLVDDTDNTCTGATKIDNTFADEPFTLVFGTDDIDVIVTSFASITDPTNPGVTTGPVTLSTRGILCDGTTADRSGNAAGDVTDTQTTYDQCFRALYESGATVKCSTDNPCARNTSGALTGKFCALQPNVHTAGTPITLVPDAAAGPCH